ncbi:MAG: hypothetical protein JSV78_07210 [Phycisphaerales bacterium]|nr:MAG: hypothetical protein JSV78_07210 [Phycisphaerales bacterium]
MNVKATQGERVIKAAKSGWSTELCDEDQLTYERLVTTDLSAEQQERSRCAAEVFARQESVLAVHWHPEFVPLHLVRERIDATFPNRTDELIIPTQHNILVSYDGFSGVEVDCYSRGFDRKVQLLVHFANERLTQADVFKDMLAHTFEYRSRQLFEFIDSVLEPAYEYRFARAAAETGADEELTAFVRVHAEKVKKLYDKNESITPPEAVRNKLLMNYFETLRDTFSPRFVDRALTFLRAVKQDVKAHFSNEYFYATEAVIEEVRSLGGGIIVPHPEQFWPILLADYHVDGYEVWNPQSQEYSEFLINVVARQNKSRARTERPLLITMGDDCHLGEKVKEPRFQDPDKAGREVGVQPAWDDPAIRKSLILADADRGRVIEEYRNRLTT